MTLFISITLLAMWMWSTLTSLRLAVWKEVYVLHRKGILERKHEYPHHMTMALLLWQLLKHVCKLLDCLGRASVCMHKMYTHQPSLIWRASVTGQAGECTSASMKCMSTMLGVSVFVCTMPMAWVAVVRCRAMHTCGSLSGECPPVLCTVGGGHTMSLPCIEIVLNGYIPMCLTKVTSSNVDVLCMPLACVPPACYVWGVHIS